MGQSHRSAVRARIEQQRKEIAEKGVSKPQAHPRRSFDSATSGVDKVDKVDIGGAWRISKSESTGEIVLEPQSPPARPSSSTPALMALRQCNLGGHSILKALAAGFIRSQQHRPAHQR